MNVYFIKAHGKYKAGEHQILPREDALKLARLGVIVFTPLEMNKHIDVVIETASIEPQSEKAMKPKPKPRKPRAKK